MWNKKTKMENVVEGRLNRIMLVVVGLRQKAQRTGWRRFQLSCVGLGVLSSLVCAASVMCATSALAGGLNDHDDDDKVRTTKVFEHFKDAPWIEEDPCMNNNLIVGTGDLFTVVITNRPTGIILSDTTTRIHQNGKGKNLDVSDTAMYKYDFWNEVNIRSSTRNYTFKQEVIKHLNRSGNQRPHDDWSFRESLKLSGDTPETIVVTRTTFSSICR